MMCGVMRMDGMRPCCARRRTVDSLTCKTAASWRAVKNSSRDSCGWGVASVIRIHPAVPGLLGLALNREGHAIDHRPINLHVLRLRLFPFGPNRQAIRRLVRREAEN